MRKFQVICFLKLKFYWCKDIYVCVYVCMYVCFYYFFLSLLLRILILLQKFHFVLDVKNQKWQQERVLKRYLYNLNKLEEFFSVFSLFCFLPIAE